MPRQICARSAKCNTFRRQARPLFQSRLPWKPDTPSRTEYPMPGKTAFGVMKCPGYLTRRAWKTGRPGDIAIGGDPPFGDPADGFAELLQHAFSPI